MSKRTIAILCTLALLLSMIPASVPTAAAATSTTATPAATGTFKVGFAKICINPKNNVAYPLGGYDSGTGRVPSDGKADYMDDNGDGSVVAGIGGKLYASNIALDGLFATAIAMQDENGKIAIFIGMDGISLASDLVFDFTENGATVPGARNKIVTEAAERGFTVEAASIMVNASHSHSGIIMSGDATKPYRADLRQWLTDVAVAALEDLQPATIYKGSMATENMNFVRHYNDNDSDKTVADLGGDNTSLWSDGQYTSSYIDCDPNVYMIRFARSGDNDVLLANWRAHPKCNSTGTNAYGLANRSCTSSDYINAFRYNLEQKGYDIAFFQGAAGNVNTYTDAYGGLNGTSIDSRNLTNRATITTYSGKKCQTGNLYGKTLANYVISGLSSMKQVSAGAIRINTYRQTANRDLSKANIYNQTYNVTVTSALNSSSYNNLSASDKTKAKNNWGSMTVLQFLADYFNYSDLYKSGNDKVEETTLSGSVAKILQKTYKINSKYHLNTLYAQRNYTADDYGSFDINAISIGSSIGFMTTPFEIFDCNYNPNVTIPGYETYKPLAGLNASYGTPFVMGYTNVSGSYMPAAYAFDVAYSGSYEVNQTYYEEGTAEAIAANLVSMLNDLQPSLSTTCPGCGAKNVTWYNWEPNSTTAVPTGHYYLSEDYTTGTNWQKQVYGSICLHLNGHTFANGSNITGRNFVVHDGATLNLMGTGTVRGRGITTPASGGAIQINGGGTVNVYSGVTIKLEDHSADDTPQIAYRGGLIYVAPNGTFNLRGGTLTAGIATSTDTLTGDGGAIYNLGTFEMFSGTITGCTADRYGGAVFNNGRFIMHAGTITGGSAVSGSAIFNGQAGVITINNGTINGSSVTGNGGAVYSSGTFTINNGTINGSSATENGGAIYNSGTFTMENGTVTGGSAYDGGSVYNIGTFTMNNGKISGGSATHDAGTLYVAGSHKATLNGGTITGGTATRYGGNLWVSGSFEMNGGTVSNGTDAGLGHNILVANRMDFKGGTVSSNKSGKSIRVNSTANLTMSGNATVNGGTVALQYASPNLGNLNLGGAYYGDAVIVAEGGAGKNVVLGSVSAGSTMKENALTYSGGTYSIAISGTDLILSASQASEAICQIINADGSEGATYTSFKAALAAYNAANGGYIKLLRDVPSSAFAEITEDVLVEMNGMDMYACIAPNVSFNGMDSQTDDYSVEGDTLGVLTVVSGTPSMESACGENRYLALPGANGTYTFHRFSLDTKKGLRPYNEGNGTGLYFQPFFQADEDVAAAINNGSMDYGVVVTMDKTVDGGEIIPIPQSFSAYTFEVGNTNSDLRVILYGLMPDNAAVAKHENHSTVESYLAAKDISKYPVTGQAYFQIGETYIVDTPDQTISLREAIYKVDQLYPSMSPTSAQRTGLDNMWRHYSSVISSWSSASDGGVDNGLLNIGNIKIDISDWFD